MQKVLFHEKAAQAKAGPVEELRITGGEPLRGEVSVRGAKNAISKEMVAALLTREPCVLRNVADVSDTRVVAGMIQAMGGAVEGLGTDTLTINAANIAPIDHRELKMIGRRSRIPILFAGPLLARFGEAMLPELGGCGIGPRPINYHVAALEKLGATVEPVWKGIHVAAKKLAGAKIVLEYPSVGATEQALLSSVLAEGTTIVENAAIQPEIMDLVALLQKMGAIIAVDTDRVITVSGVPELRGYDHTAIPDRIEAASWACAAAVTNGNVFVRGARQMDMMTFLNTFRKVGGEFAVAEDGIRFSRGPGLAPITLETDVHPGFMTDWQQPFTVLLTQAEGTSIVHETVYEERFGYVAALEKMGADIKLHTECLGGKSCRFAGLGHVHSALVTGPARLRAASIEIPDLRAGFSYVIAALAADGASTIRGSEVLSRGYERFLEKLKDLHAAVTAA